jgi:hypothetical protein
VLKGIPEGLTTIQITSVRTRIGRGVAEMIEGVVYCVGVLIAGQGKSIFIEDWLGRAVKVVLRVLVDVPPYIVVRVDIVIADILNCV